MNAIPEETVQTTVDLTGQWQGVDLAAGNKEERIALKLWKEDDAWAGVLKDLDTWGGEQRYLVLVEVQGSALRLAVGGWSYEGEIGADGNSIVGNRTIVHTRPLRFNRATEETRWDWRCPMPHTIQFVEVEAGVKLEVLDWGGTGRPLIFLAGHGGSAHTFDNFAPMFTEVCHVYGVTERGFGWSSRPKVESKNYNSDRLGDDVLAVMNALGIDRPVLAGRSGAEMSSVGSRFPEKVAGLIYLDSGYGPAYYSPKIGYAPIDERELFRNLEELNTVALGKPRAWKPLVEKILQEDLPGLERSLRDMHEVLEAMPDVPQKPPEAHVAPSRTPDPLLRHIMLNLQKYTRIDCPIYWPFLPIPPDTPITTNTPTTPELRKPLEPTLRSGRSQPSKPFGRDCPMRAWFSSRIPRTTSLRRTRRSACAR